MNKLKIGVFDSGIGGLSVKLAIEKQFPDAEVQFINDEVHVPYGIRPLSEIYGFTLPLVQRLVNDGCQVIVIACNTVTTNLIGRLREDIAVPLIGMEPMVKPAAERSRSKVIAVCATPRTLESERYHWLKTEYAKGVTVLEPDCSDWAALIEADLLNRQKIQLMVDAVCDQGADQIVLGCTHYHWIEDVIRHEAAGRAEVMQPEQPVIAQLKKVIESL